MIVVFTGSHGTGKSSLIEKLKSWDNVECVNSVTRSTISAKERRIDGVKDLDRSQYDILGRVIELTGDLIKKNQENPNKIFLADRSIFDFVAYTRAFHKRGLVSDECLRTIEGTTQNISQNYDLICYLPIEFDIVDDGIRSLDEELRRIVDQEIQEQIKGKENVIKLSGSYEERIESLRSRIIHTGTQAD